MHKRVMKPSSDVPSLEYLEELEAAEATSGGEKPRKDSTSAASETPRSKKARKKRQHAKSVFQYLCLYMYMCKADTVFSFLHVYSMFSGESQETVVEALVEAVAVSPDAARQDVELQNPKVTNAVRSLSPVCKILPVTWKM